MSQTAPDIRIKRAYDPPAPEDGARFLVDRLWPRGRSRAELELVDWLRDLAPSTELRQRFHHRPERWDEFRRAYAAELDQQPELLSQLLLTALGGPVTLVYGAADQVYNNAAALREYLLNGWARSAG